MVLVPYERHPAEEARGDFEGLQDNIEEFTDKLVDQPHLDGLLIEDIAITTGQNDITHKLGRTMRGWWIARDEVPMADASAYLASDQTGLSSTDLIELDTETYDYGSNFDTSTSLFTAPVTGLYSIHWQARFQSLGDGEIVLAYLVKNGSTTLTLGSTFASGAASVENISHGSQVALLTAADTIGMHSAFTVAANVIDGGAEDTFMTISLLTGLTEAVSANEATTLTLDSQCGRTASVVVF